MIKAVIKHNGKGWIEIFKSEGMQEVVDQAGLRIAQNAGEHFEYRQMIHNNFTVGGVVGAADITGAYLQATDKVLEKAVY